MADLDPLVRYRKHGVDEKRRILAELYQQAEKLERQKTAIEEQVEEETKLAEGMATAEASAYLGRYLEGARTKIETLNGHIRQMEIRIAVAQEDMRTAFAEMKKVEITQRNRKDKEKAAEKKKEDQELDEVAIENYRRRQKDDGGD